MESTLHRHFSSLSSYWKCETHLLQTFSLLLQSPDIKPQFSWSAAQVHSTSATCCSCRHATKSSTFFIFLSINNSTHPPVNHFLLRGMSTQPLMQKITTLSYTFPTQEMNLYPSTNGDMSETCLQSFLVQLKVKNSANTLNGVATQCHYPFLILTSKWHSHRKTFWNRVAFEHNLHVFLDITFHSKFIRIHYFCTQVYLTSQNTYIPKKSHSSMTQRMVLQLKIV